VVLPSCRTIRAEAGRLNVWARSSGDAGFAKDMVIIPLRPAAQ
jgi:hypothetical protein